MGYKYNLDDRDLGGSMTPRLNPKIVNRELNAKLGPKFPPENGKEPNNSQRRSVMGLPSRFDNKG